MTEFIIILFTLTVLLIFGIVGYKHCQKNNNSSYIFYKKIKNINWKNALTMYATMQLLFSIALFTKQGHEFGNIVCIVGIPIILMSMIFLYAFFGKDVYEFTNKIDIDDKKKFIRDRKLEKILK